MPTNDERREVAARLRDYVDLDFEDANPYWYVMKSAYGDVSIHGDNELFSRLADLIEPEPERTCKMEIVKSGPRYIVWRFSCCGFYFSENITDSGATDLPGTRCPKCGAVVDHER